MFPITVSINSTKQSRMDSLPRNSYFWREGCAWWVVERQSSESPVRRVVCLSSEDPAVNVFSHYQLLSDHVLQFFPLDARIELLSQPEERYPDVSSAGRLFVVDGIFFLGVKVGQSFGNPGALNLVNLFSGELIKPEQDSYFTFSKWNLLARLGTDVWSAIARSP